MIAGNTGGQALSLTDDSFYIKITEVSGAAHGWVRVERNRAHLWDETSERASVTNDPAYEVNANAGTVGQIYKAWRHPTSGEVLFFLTNRCLAPVDPGWPVSLFAFHGILEYGYIDSSIGTINSSVVDKASIENIQDFRIAQFNNNGTTAQFRGASGWYFQAAASTAEIRINNTVNDERNITDRASWGNVVDEWENGTDINPISQLFLGLTTFGGYGYGARDPDIEPGNANYPRHLSSPGPIRLTYLYGDTENYNSCDMQFELQSACKARLKGTTQDIPDWANEGSLVPDTTAADISILPGTDNFVVFDGLRAIRIRPLGWLAHMADHAMKPNDTFNSGTFPAGMTMVWKENSAAFAYDDGDALGDFTPQYTEANGTITYGYSLEWSAFHHYHFGNWADTTLGAPDRYNLKAIAKVWYYNEDDTSPSRPDIYKVNIGTLIKPADEIVQVTAQERQTVHQGPTGPPFNDPPTYANNPGFVFTFSETVDNIAWLHMTIHYNDQIVGAQFWGGNEGAANGFPVLETYNNAILFQKETTEVITDDLSASLIGQPFGRYANSPLPPVFIAVLSVTGTRFRAVDFQIVWTIPKPGSGVTYDIDYGDGSSDTGTTSDLPEHTYDSDAGTVYRVVLKTITSTKTYTHGTTIKV